MKGFFWSDSLEKFYLSLSSDLKIHGIFIKQQMNKNFSESIMEGILKISADWNTRQKAVLTLGET